MQDGVSVVIPTFNSAAYLEECVRSVLAQTVAPTQIIVIDDGSQDNTPEVAARLGTHIRYERQGHAGAAAARNTAVKLVQTEFVAFLDCDDLWATQKLEWQLAALSRAGEAAMAFGHVQQFVSPELTANEAAALKYQADPMPAWSASALLMRSRNFERVGPFDATIQMGEFAEWFSRAKDAGLKALLLPEVVCHRRLHRNNFGRRSAALRADYARTLKKVLDRRRGQP